MGLQILRSSGRVAALLTRKGLFSSVCEHMAPKHCGHMPLGPEFVKMGTQFLVKWGPNGDPQQQNGDPKSQCLQN